MNAEKYKSDVVFRYEYHLFFILDYANKLSNNMKRTVLFFVLSFIFVYSVIADSVAPEQAMLIAKQFVPQSSTAKKMPRKGEKAQEATIVYTHMMPKSQRPAFYIVNVGDGSFVLVSADDVAHQILGYNFDMKWPEGKDGTVQLPPHVKSFFDDLASQMESAIDAEPDCPAVEDLSDVQKRSGRRSQSNLPEKVDPLLTTTWDQGQYYNALCPEDAGGPDGHVWAGCVATAMAQIIKYWSNPVQGRGTHSYDSTYGTLSVNYAESNYDFSNMPEELTDGSTEAQVHAVSKLMYDCGVAANMGYGPEESSANVIDVRASLINYYHFSPNLSYVEKAYFSDSEWENMLHKEIANGHPVYYSGRGSSGGHAFVCDGYKQNNLFHLNFGWGGFADGWYLINAITPGILSYNSNQTALIEIYPDNDANVVLSPMLGTSTFVVDEPLEFYNLLGHNAYIGASYSNSFESKIVFIPKRASQIVANTIDYYDQTIRISDDINEELRSITPNGNNDLSPIVSQKGILAFNYSGKWIYSGFKFIIQQDDENRMISNVVPIVENNKVSLSWRENGDATNWQVEYGLRGFDLGEGTSIISNDTKIIIDELAQLTEYDFYIRPLGREIWFGPVTVHTKAPYWIDIVNTQPDGFVVSTELDQYGRYPIAISTAEGLAWWAKQVNNQGSNMPIAHTTINITADINLEGYRWKPVSEFYGAINGNGHVISNMTIIEEDGEPNYSFIAHYRGYMSENRSTIDNLRFQDPYIKCPDGVYGVLAGRLYLASIKNCGVNNATIIQYNHQPEMVERGVTGGGLVGSLMTSDITNCYINGTITSKANSACFNINGGFVGNVSGYNNSMDNNYCSMRVFAESGWKGGICAYMTGGDIHNCYGADYNLPLIGFNDESYGIIADTMLINRGALDLNNYVYFDGNGYNDLLTALNKRVEFENDSNWCMWQADNSGLNNGFPILGNKYIVKCPNPENVVALNREKESDYALHLSWKNDEQASRWKIKCWEADSTDETALFYHTETNSFDIEGLTIGRFYNISVRQYYDDTNYSGWSAPVKIMFDKPYWTDVVTTQPEGFIEDEEGNITIASAEGLAWLSCLINGLHNQENRKFFGKKVSLIADIDLSRYKWMPMGYNYDYTFQGSFDGQNHSISNLYVNEKRIDVGLFGRIFLFESISQPIFKNLTIVNGIVNGESNVGTILGHCHSNEIDPITIFDNCHAIDAYVTGLYGVGALMGYCETDCDLSIVNCSSSGNVRGTQNVGGLFGELSLPVNKSINNCYSSCHVYSDPIYPPLGYSGGLIGYIGDAVIQNGYYTGTVENTGSISGKLIGVLHNATGKYLYGLRDNDKWPLIGLLYLSSEASDTASFSNNGILETQVSINDTNYNQLLSALNAWVDANNLEGQYRHWVADTENKNGGFPIFAPRYTLTYKVDGEVYQTKMLEAGAMLTAEDEPTKEGYMFGGWSEIPATMPDHDVEITGEFHLYGDVNIDTEVDVVDVVDIARYVVEIPSENFKDKLADLNFDKTVNIADAVVLVNHIAGDQNFVKAWNAPNNFVENDILGLSENNEGLFLYLDNERNYTAFQLDLFVSEDIDISTIKLNTERKQDHQLLYNKVENGHYRVVALSTSNQSFKGYNGELLNIVLSGMSDNEVSVRNICFFDANGQSYLFDDIFCTTTTGIQSFENGKIEESIYDLQGRKLSKVQRGINIIGDKKVVVK